MAAWWGLFREGLGDNAIGPYVHNLLGRGPLSEVSHLLLEFIF